MSLLKNSETACTLLVRTQAPDGRGAQTTAWADGETFTAAVWKKEDRTVESGEKAGVIGGYAVLAHGIVLHFHDVFRRESDGMTFRVLANGTETEPPASASAMIGGLTCNVTAEEWEIPTEVPDE